MKVLGLFLLALLCGAFPVFAQPALVTAGEHPGFTRVVVQFGGPVDWQLGRSDLGYSLRITPKAPDYDVKNVFNFIGKTRLTATSVDPATGDLTLRLTCACYALPYEQRPGVVVVDLRDGVAPAGSSFELPLEKLNLAQPDTKDLSAPYDWTSLPPPTTGAGLPLAADLGRPNPAPAPSLEPLRLSLIQDLSRGASQGVVDMVVPDQGADQPAIDGASSPNIQIGAEPSADPNLVTRQMAKTAAPLTAQGAPCWADDRLDIASWGGQQPVAAQFGPQREGLSGEFDIPDPAAVTRAIRFQLFLGFGAEARSLTRAFAPNAPDAALWRSMAHILDHESDPAPAFAGMEDCETAAALWATLAAPDAMPISPQGKAAVLRSFSALPPQLRHLLGPVLVGRVLTAGDLTLATPLYDATLRAQGDQTPELIMMQAQMDRALGKPEQAIAKVNELAKDPGQGAAEALVDLVEAKAPLGQPITFAQVQALEAALTERRGSPEVRRFERALVLAKAASGDFDGAFGGLATAPDSAALVWQLLAQSAPDSAFLSHACLAPTDPVPAAALAVADKIADRMLGLGLADQAGLWGAQAHQATPELLARVKLAQGDAQAVLTLLSTHDSTAALQLKALAHQALGQASQAADLYGHLGESDRAWHFRRQAGDWRALATNGPAPWQAVAALTTNPAPKMGIGALAQDKALIDHSTATRGAILALLDQTKLPVAVTQ